jgi:CRP/FNR family cyclic AMP-dependent transcriptional regulator
VLALDFCAELADGFTARSSHRPLGCLCRGIPATGHRHPSARAVSARGLLHAVTAKIRISTSATTRDGLFGHATKHATIPLLAADPDLGAHLAPARHTQAGSLVVATHRLGVGAWPIPRTAGTNTIGVLIMNGVIARRLTVANQVSAELLGRGDFIRCRRPGDPANLLPVAAQWSVLSPATVAVLDRRRAELTQWPEILNSLLDRLAERCERLATTQAISQMTRIDRRLITLFWHLADRWGRVSPDGIVIPLALTQRLLGQLVGAQRQTVCTALKQLIDRGELARRPDRSWLLRGDPPPPTPTAPLICSQSRARDLLCPPR